MAMRACKFYDKQSMDARKQMSVQCADINATTNQQRVQQDWVVVVVVVIATATAVTTMATQWRNGGATTQQPINEGISKSGRWWRRQ